MGERFDERTHGAAILGGFSDDDRDLLETGGDRLRDAAVPGLDDKPIAAIGLRRDDWRLHDADRLDRGQQ